VVGCDHYFKSQGTPHAVIQLAGEDPNHFAPITFPAKISGNCQTWLAQSRITKWLGKTTREQAGELYNSTNGGHLELFPRKDLESFLSE
jgi:hypothetical protein